MLIIVPFLRTSFQGIIILFLGFFKDREDAVDIAFYFAFQEELDDEKVQRFIEHILHFCSDSRRKASLSNVVSFPPPC